LPLCPFGHLNALLRALITLGHDRDPPQLKPRTVAILIQFADVDIYNAAVRRGARAKLG
jgi:hypothetical protein